MELYEITQGLPLSCGLISKMNNTRWKNPLQSFASNIEARSK